jgi:hypothetical protein
MIYPSKIKIDKMVMKLLIRAGIIEKTPFCVKGIVPTLFFHTQFRIDLDVLSMATLLINT